MSSHSCLPNPALIALVANPDELPTAGVRVTEEMSDATDPSHIYVGQIITMDEALPTAEALAVKGDKIMAVGAAEEVRSLAGSDTEIVEPGSGVMYPGLIEPHVHLWVTAINYDWVDCSAFTNKTVEDVKQKLTAAAAAAGPDDWILGKLFDPSLLPGMPDLTIADLDPIAPDKPVFILNASMHFAYVNSKALELAGITAETKDPAGGFYERDESGKPNGVIAEMAAILPFLQYVKGITPDTVARNISRITDDAARVGVTTVREAATGALFGPKEVGLLHHVQQAGGIKTRISLALADDLAQDWPDDPATANGAGNEHVWIGARKMVTDGSNQGETGYQSEPYLNSKERGKLDVDPEIFKKRLAWCHENGWQVMIHANGDAAVETTVKTLQEVLGSEPDKDLRHRIEHCSMVNNDKLFADMRQIGVTPSFLINHLYFWGKTLRDNIIGQERIHMLDRVAAAAQAGLKFTLHSDYNVSPINPLHYVYVAANRILWDGGETLEASQKVSVAQAMKAITIDAAWQINADDRLGSLTAGKLADFVILDKDPLAVQPETVDAIKVLQTYRGGQQTYDASK